jgi:nucleotide-binding universal stress UspA family protein
VYSCSPEGGYRYPSLEESTKLLADATNLLRRSGFTLVAAESLLGEPASTICQYADDHQIDLIVIGNKGKGGLKKFWVGSVSQEIFQNASQSVLLLNNESEKNIQVTSPEALLLHPGTCDL